MYSAPDNNPLSAASAAAEGCIWDGEEHQDREPMATAPQAATNPPPAPPAQSNEREQPESRTQLSWRTTPPTRSLFSSQEPPPIVYSTSKPRIMGRPSTFSHRHTSRDSSPEEENVRRLFETIGHLSISDSAFALQPFSGSTHSSESAEKWLEKFRRYVAFKKITEADQVQLFHLLMCDQAADWLAALPDVRKMFIQDLMQEFVKRHELSRVEKWRQTADIWKRKQAIDESVDDYVASMQAAARRINMATDSLIDAIIQGLLPHIRLHVLHTGADSIEGIIDAARVSEAAHAANLSQNTQVDKLTAKVEQLIEKISTQASIDTPKSPTSRRVSFQQNAISSTPSRDRSASPAGRPRTPDNFRSQRSTDQSPSRQQDSRAVFQRQQPSRPAAHEQYTRRDGPFRRNTAENQQYARPWRGQQQYTAPTTTTYNQTGQGDSAVHPQPAFSNPGYRPVYNACRFCGGFHSIGRRFCPAANVQCFNCTKMGHLAKVCRSRPANEEYNSRTYH
jgi:hypothetical protein